MYTNILCMFVYICIYINRYRYYVHIYVYIYIHIYIGSEKHHIYTYINEGDKCANLGQIEGQRFWLLLKHPIEEVPNFESLHLD